MKEWTWSIVAGGLLVAGCASVEPAVVTMHGGDPASADAAVAPFEPPADLLAEGVQPAPRAVPAGEHEHRHSAEPGMETVESRDEPTPVNTCPMHPEVTSAKEGECPKCGMRLVKRKVDG